VWSNGGVVLSRGKLKKQKEQPAAVLLHPPHIPQDVTCGLNLRLSIGKPVHDLYILKLL
jgi:hypothetical protein